VPELNLFRKVWLAAKVKAALGGNMDAFKSVAAWVFKLNLIPAGYLTVGAGWIGILLAAACVLHISIPGYTCPQDPASGLMEAISGLGLVGLGRRKA
jgi:hypothetical protein